MDERSPARRAGRRRRRAGRGTRRAGRGTRRAPGVRRGPCARLAAAPLAASLLAHAAGPHAAGPNAGERTRIVLAENWFVKRIEGEEPDIARLAREAASPDASWLPARMPAQVHDVLLAHGRIPDPHVGRNAARCAWVGEKDWAYACRFPSPRGRGGPILLRFEGLDTLADAYLDGARIGRFDDMHRRYAVDITDRLAPPGGENVLLVVFHSPLRAIARPRPARFEGIARHKFLRKSHADFSAYLGARPHFVKVGIYRDVALDVLGPSWIDDVWIRTRLAADRRRAEIIARVTVSGEPAAIAWTLRDPDGAVAARGTREPAAGPVEIRIDVDAPRLWWPHTHGSPELYALVVALGDAAGRIDGMTVRFGIRDIRIVLSDPRTGEKRFRFDVNGRPIFLRGACWAPLEGMTHCWRPARAARLLDLAVRARMNAIRVWGEGHIPPRSFYDACDRRGILIWQDFMFGYGMHPSGEPAFAARCRAEIEDMILRLRNHPCILLWVGGNENHMGWDFAHGTAPSIGRELFDAIMPRACARLDPDRYFHESSPYGGPVPNWPLEGDWHDYTTLTFCPQASVPLFASEVGRASAPSLRSMRRFLRGEDLWPEGFDPAVREPGRPAWPPMWQYRSVGGSWDKVGPVERYCDPRSAADLIRVLGTAHGEYLRERVERERRGVPDGAPATGRRCWGNLIWRLNDAWPIVYWSAIDYYLEPKIPYYFLRRAYDPILVSFERTADRIAVWVVDDGPEPVAGTLRVRRERLDGRVIGGLEVEVRVAPGEARRCLDLTPLGPIVLRREFLRATFAGREVTYLLAGERHLHLPRANLQAHAVAGGIEIATDGFARQVTLEAEGPAEALYEDNFFDLPPGSRRTVGLVDPAGARAVRVRALNAAPVRVVLGPAEAGVRGTPPGAGGGGKEASRFRASRSPRGGTR